MFQIEIAGHCFAIHNTYPYVEELCGDYITAKPPEAVINVSQEEIEKENTDGGKWSEGYLESLAIYRKISERLLDENIILFHCSAIEMDGKAYLFTAPSGTGKSTHTKLWRAVFGNRVTMINDDKPLVSIPLDSSGVKMAGDVIRVYGTPYAGKDGLQTNISAPVEAIVILHQAMENSIERLDGRSAYPILLNQTYRRNDPAGMMKTMELVGQLANLPVYSLGCNISEEAVMTAYRGIVKNIRM